MIHDVAPKKSVAAQDNLFLEKLIISEFCKIGKRILLGQNWYTYKYKKITHYSQNQQERFGGSINTFHYQKISNEVV